MATLVSRSEMDTAARARSAPPTRVRVGLGVGLRVGLTLAALAAAWWFLAPAQLGGATAFMTVDGTSMLPRLQPSELVLLRRAGDYRVGDVVGYRSTLLGRVVLHRIVAVHGGRYTFKGDNNSFTDPDHPTRGQLVGKLWFSVPRAGRAVPILHTPWVVAALAAVLVLVLGLGGRPLVDRPERE
jgi:signal peptidase I